MTLLNGPGALKFCGVSTRPAGDALQPVREIAATPVDAASSCSIVQLTAAAGHALAIWAMGNILAAATDPVT